MVARGKKPERERDENKADTAARATMAHRPAKTRADAQKRARRVCSDRTALQLILYISRSTIILSARTIFR